MTTSRVIRLTAAPKRRAAQRAYTIIEILAVVALLGLTATIVIPSTSPGESIKLDLVANEIANAMRFARSEAMRTGSTIGFQHQTSANRIRVFSIDIDSSPATITYDVYHPVDKQKYIRQFDEPPYSFDGKDQHISDYRGSCNTGSKVYFDADGTAWCPDPTNLLLERFSISLKLGNSTRLLTLDGITGRVTVE